MHMFNPRNIIVSGDLHHESLRDGVLRPTVAKMKFDIPIASDDVKNHEPVAHAKASARKRMEVLLLEKSIHNEIQFTAR